MAYKTKELYKQAINAIEKHKLFWIEQVVVYLPCTKPTFYEHFRIESNEFNVVKTLLEDNRIKACQTQNIKWLDSDNSALQIAARKLIGSDAERKKLSQTYQDVSIEGKEDKPITLTVEQINKFIDKL